MRRIEPRTDGPTRAGRRLRAAAFALVAGVLVASAAMAVTVDDFGDNQGPLSTAGVPASSVPAAVGTILGGERDMQVTATGAGDVTADVGLSTASALTFASPAGTAGMLEVQWDGVDTSAALAPTGLGGIDLTTGGDDALQVVVNSATAGAILKITVHTDAQQLSIFRRALPAIAAPTTLNIAYADFLGNANFANVGAVVLMLSGDGVTVELGTPIATGTGAVNVSATKAAAIAVASDADADGEVDPGEQIQYTVEITSIGTTATTLDLTDTVDANTTFVGGSIETTPLALDDSYSSLGNVGISVPAGSGLLVNDTDPDGSGLAAPPISAADSMSAQGGTVSVTAADGAFTYTPPPGFAGVDFFSYTLADGEGNTDVGTVAITVADRIWFIDNGAGAAGNGTLATPFNTLAAFEAINGNGGATDPAAGDCIYVDTGGGNYAGGVTLEASQLLIGQGATGGTLATLCGVTPPTHSATLPTLAGTNPAIVNTAGNGITLASNNILRGLDVGATSGAGIFGNFGTLTVRDVAVNGSGQILDLTNGNLDAVFDSLSTTGTAAAVDAIDLATITGSLTVTNNAGTDTSIAGAGGRGISVQSSGGASFSFGDTGVTSTAAGIDLGSGGANPMASFTFNSLSVTTTAGSGLIANQSGTVTIGGTANSVIAAGGPAVNVTGGTNLGTGWTFATLSSTSSPTDGINLDNVGGTAGLTANGGAITTPTGIGIDLNLVPVPFTYAGTMDNNAGRSVEVTNSGGTPANTIAFTGSIDDDGTGVFLDNNDSGAGATVRFSGGLAVDTGATTGFTATNGGTVEVCANTGCGAGTPVVNSIGAANGMSRTAINVSDTTIGASGITFQEIDVDGGGTSAVPAIILDDTGAGTFTVTGIDGPCGNTAMAIDCDGGTLENILADAVTLNNTGGRVTFENMLFEDIGNMAGDADGIDVRSQHDAIHGQTAGGGLTLDNTTIRRISDQGVNGALFAGGVAATTWVGLTVVDSLLEDTNRFHVAGQADNQDEGAIRIDGVTGTVSVTGSTLRRGAALLELFSAASGTLGVTVTNSDFEDAYKEGLTATASLGRFCVAVTSKGSTNTTVTVGAQGDTTPGHGADTGNEFIDCKFASIVIAHDQGASGNLDAIVANNTFRVTDHSSDTGFGNFPQGGVALRMRGGTLDGIVEYNQFGVAVGADDRVGSTDDEITNANGGEGAVSLILENATGGGVGAVNGAAQVRVNHNQFNGPTNAPYLVRADRNSSAAVYFHDNTHRGRDDFSSPDPGYGTFTVPGIPSRFRARNGGSLDMTIEDETMVFHDQAFFLSTETLEFESLDVGTGHTVCVALDNVVSPDGFELTEENGTGTVNLYQGTVNNAAAGPCTAGSTADCEAELGDDTVRGGPTTRDASTGTPDGTLNPPFVDVDGGSITITGTACAKPSGGIF